MSWDRNMSNRYPTLHRTSLRAMAILVRDGLAREDSAELAQTIGDLRTSLARLRPEETNGGAQWAHLRLQADLDYAAEIREVAAEDKLAPSFIAFARDEVIPSLKRELARFERPATTLTIEDKSIIPLRRNGRNTAEDVAAEQRRLLGIIDIGDID